MQHDNIRNFNKVVLHTENSYIPEVMPFDTVSVIKRYISLFVENGSHSRKPELFLKHCNCLIQGVLLYLQFKMNQIVFVISSFSWNVI